MDLSQDLRRNHESIAVGIGTVLRDDPLLTCRVGGCKKPLRVVFDSRLRLPPGCRLATGTRDAPVLVFCAGGNADDLDFGRRKKTLEEAGVLVAEISRDGEGLSIEAALGVLIRRSIGSLLVEGGGMLLTSFLKRRLANRMVVVTAPIFIGTGTEAVGDLGISLLSEALRPKKVSIRTLGNDAVWEMDL
jgi:diaminohydroxyphosphoribosylaminopyrimidine deaminase/5-amino-6-(5-phosphoribosylamino)uracil reductase